MFIRVDTRKKMNHFLVRILFINALFVFKQFAVCLYRDLMEAGRELSVRNVGRSAVDCLRIERGIPQMGSELTSFVTPKEAGLMDWVRIQKVWFKHWYSN